jgi:hypothetical protein
LGFKSKAGIQRDNEILKFYEDQITKFQKITKNLKNEMNMYHKARKSLWMENDILNRIENQKIYEKELRKIMLRFMNFKRDGYKKYSKELKHAQKSATKYSEKDLIKQIKTIAIELNNETTYEAKYDYDEMLEEIIKIDYEHEKKYQEDLKMANIQAEKFAMKR